MSGFSSSREGQSKKPSQRERSSMHRQRPLKSGEGQAKRSIRSSERGHSEKEKCIFFSHHQIIDIKWDLIRMGETVCIDTHGNSVMSHGKKPLSPKIRFFTFLHESYKRHLFFTVTLRWVSLTWMPSPRMAIYRIFAIIRRF